VVYGSERKRNATPLTRECARDPRVKPGGRPSPPQFFVLSTSALFLVAATCRAVCPGMRTRSGGSDVIQTAARFG
jgi:hypothetical protein